MQLNDRAFDALERVNERTIRAAVIAERERIAKFIEDMDDGPITTKAVKSYIAAAVRNLSE